MSSPLSSILIVDDEPDICRQLAALVQREGLVPLVAHDGQGALALVRTERPWVLLLDLKLPDMDGLELLRQIKAWDETIAVVIITGHAGIAGAVEAMRAGANDYVAKPFEHEEILRVLRRALAGEKLRLNVPGSSLGVNASDPDLMDLQRLMGRSQAIGQLIAHIRLVAQSPLNVLITGETGSGKELVAQAIHRLSARAKQAFVPVDCGAVPETLFEGELLGHEKGAFTGAVSLRRGKLELAHGGTLFLDEILNTPPGCQAKLLRALQERSFTRVGGDKAVETDVRVLGACGVDLGTEVQAGRFRADLFYRLSEFSLWIPALRERTEDILYLAERFLGSANQELKKSVKGFSGAAVEAMQTYAWPGNVRELRSTIRRAVLLADKSVTEKHLDFTGDGSWEFATGQQAVRPGPLAAPPLKDDSMKEAVSRSTTATESEVLRCALQRTGGNKAAAARLLKIDYKTIQSKIEKYGLGQKPEVPRTMKKPLQPEDGDQSNPHDDPHQDWEPKSGGILSGLAGLMSKLNELAQTGEELRRTGEIQGSGKGTKGIYGFTVKVGLGDQASKVEPFGNLHTDRATGKTVVHEMREPLVDVFEEGDHVLIVSEMPGIGVKDVHLDVEGDVVTLAATRGDKRYRKEILVPGIYPRNKMQVTCNNGVVEIKCYK